MEDKEERPVASLAKTLVDHGKLEISYEELNGMIKEDERTNLY